MLEWTRCLGCQLYGAVFAIISSRSQLADWRIGIDAALYKYTAFYNHTAAIGGAMGGRALESAVDFVPEGCNGCG